MSQKVKMIILFEKINIPINKIKDYYLRINTIKPNYRNNIEGLKKKKGIKRFESFENNQNEL